MSGLRRGKPGARRRSARRGAATIDLALLLGIILPLAAFVLWAAPRIMNLVYEMIGLFVSWPFM